METQIKLPVKYEGLNWEEKHQIRKEYIKLQKGKCVYCGNPLTEEPIKEVQDKNIHEYLYPPNFFNFPIHLHHNHETGMTVGVVHCYCNAVM